MGTTKALEENTKVLEEDNEMSITKEDAVEAVVRLEENGDSSECTKELIATEEEKKFKGPLPYKKITITYQIVTDYGETLGLPFTKFADAEKYIDKINNNEELLKDLCPDSDISQIKYLTIEPVVECKRLLDYLDEKYSDDNIINTQPIKSFGYEEAVVENDKMFNSDAEQERIKLWPFGNPIYVKLEVAQDFGIEKLMACMMDPIQSDIFRSRTGCNISSIYTKDSIVVSDLTMDTIIDKLKKMQREVAMVSGIQL